MAKFIVISGEDLESKLEEVVEFSFKLPSAPKNGTGILSYMIDTREGNRGYRININGHGESRISLPPGSAFATVQTTVGHLVANENVVQFASSDGAPRPLLNILNVVLFYED